MNNQTHVCFGWRQAKTFLETGRKQEAEPPRVMVPITGKHGERARPDESQLTWIRASCARVRVRFPETAGFEGGAARYQLFLPSLSHRVSA